MRPIWLGTKPPLNQSAPSPPWAMLPPSSEGVTPDAAAEYEVRTGSVGPGVGAGAGPGGGGGGGGAGGAGCGEFDESITLLPEKTVWSAPPPHAVRLAAKAATSWRRNDTSMAAMLARGRRRERRCCKRVRVTQPFEHRPREPHDRRLARGGVRPCRHAAPNRAIAAACAANLSYAARPGGGLNCRVTKRRAHVHSLSGGACAARL